MNTKLRNANQEDIRIGQFVLIKYPTSNYYSERFEDGFITLTLLNPKLYRLHKIEAPDLIGVINLGGTYMKSHVGLVIPTSEMIKDYETYYDFYKTAMTKNPPCYRTADGQVEYHTIIQKNAIDKFKKYKLIK